MSENEHISASQPAESNIITIERNGRTFLFIDHYTQGQSFADIVKSALRREMESA